MNKKLMSWEEFCDGHFTSYGVGKHPDKKKEYRRMIIGYWASSRIESGEERNNKGRKKPGPLQAMEELYEEFQEDSMIIINFTIRNRVGILRDLRSPEFYDKEYKWEIRGLESVLREWEKQVSDPKTQDSLEILIQSKPELYSKPAYMITAMIHRVRRLREGSNKNPGNLMLCDRILREAQRLFDESDEHGENNHAILANEHLELLIQMQFHLQDTRRQDFLKNQQRAYEDFTLNLIELHYPSPNPSPGIAVYCWWAMRISYMRSRANLEFGSAERWLDSMKIERSRMSDRVGAYIDCIEEGKDRNHPRDQEIVDYHRSLAKFMYYCDKSTTTKKGKRSLKDKEGLLYRAALDIEDATGCTRLFTWHVTTKPEELIRRCRKSLFNANRCISSISYRDLYSSQAMLMLVSIDLLMKIRWYLSGSNIYKIIAKWGTKRTVDGKSELEIAKELMGHIAHTLSRIQKQVIRSTGSSGQMYKLLGNWIKAIEIMEFKHAENYATNSQDAKFRGPLGQLCDFCGSMVGWKWSPMQDPVEKPNWDGDDTILLYGFTLDDGKQPKIDSDSWLKISTEGPINNPYLRKIGESASHQ
ncbi:MAG: hypothetical protein VXZ75_04630 [Candidatus Thermoplasmatota archaeon]|nr:hypothetical protein [Candidatus Thermoplasmatota archaeon]